MVLPGLSVGNKERALLYPTMIYAALAFRVLTGNTQVEFGGFAINIKEEHGKKTKLFPKSYTDLLTEYE